MSEDRTAATRALAWLARLPLSGDHELAGLLGVHEQDVRRLLHDLALRGWVDSVEPASPELERRRRYFVPEGAVAAWCVAREIDSASLLETLPVGRNAILRRVARSDITTGVNRLCADLADHLRRADLAELLDARSLPLGGRAADRWWLRGVDGYGCLRAGRLHAPFLVVWDRAAAPDLHRRQRAARWRREADGVGAHWGAVGPPPLLVVCPTTREIAVWEGALRGRTDEELTRQLDPFFTTRRALREHGVGEAIWRTATGDGGMLVEQIGWGAEPPIAPPPPVLFEAIDDIEVADRRMRGEVRRWAAQRATADAARSRWQHACALALATGAGEQVLLDWIARHPLLAASDLAALRGETTALLERQLEWLVRCRAVGTARLHRSHTQEGTSHA